MKGFGPYQPSLESTSGIRIEEKYDLFIDGNMVPPASRGHVDVINPATGEVISQIASAGRADVNKAVTAAQKAGQKVWKRMSGIERGQYLYRIARMIQERSKELAIIETIDSGKIIRESRDFDVPAAAAHFFYYAGWADKLDFVFPGRKAEPIGTVAQIIPWNFPLLMAAWKVAPALAAGNTLVLKPAETTSLSALKLTEIIRDCDLPPGVVNIITGGPETGSLLANHPAVSKVAFTGSTTVGKQIVADTAASGKKLSLELGGKGAHIVLEDAPLHQAVEGVIKGIFFNQGQVCCAGTRLFVQESIAKEFMQLLRERFSRLIVGNPLDKNTDIGPVNHQAQLERIDYYIRSGKGEGLEFFESECRLPEKGYYCRPIVFTGASQSNLVFREEVFGPVLAVQTFRTVEEVIEKANNTPYGLSAGIWTEKAARLHYIAAQLRAGVIWANTFNRFDPASPFGGYKESGFGREGGLHGLFPYLSMKE